MKRFWKWLAENSSQLQGLAAAVGILLALTAGPIFFLKWLQPNLMIKITPDSPAMPPPLVEWINDATRSLERLPDTNEGESDPFQSLRGLQVTGPLDPIRRGRWRLAEPGRLRVDVINQADRVIPGVRLRLDRGYPVWGVTLNASFLTMEEISDWQKGLSATDSDSSLVLPELPPIPPQSVITIMMYGDVGSADVSATVPGASFKLVPTVPVEDKGLIWLILRPQWWFLLLGFVFMVIFLALSVFGQIILRRSRRFVVYDLACAEAKAGRKESALALLQEAVRAGYNNFHHMRNDPDLETLRDLEAFKSLSRG